MTPKRKKEIREAALESRGGLESIKQLSDMQQPQLKQLIDALLTLTDCIIELTNEEDDCKNQPIEVKINDTSDGIINRTWTSANTP